MTMGGQPATTMMGKRRKLRLNGHSEGHLESVSGGSVEDEVGYLEQGGRSTSMSRASKEAMMMDQGGDGIYK